MDLTADRQSPYFLVLAGTKTRHTPLSRPQKREKRIKAGEAPRFTRAATMMCRLRASSARERCSAREPNSRQPAGSRRHPSRANPRRQRRWLPSATSLVRGRPVNPGSLPRVGRAAGDHYCSDRDNRRGNRRREMPPSAATLANKRHNRRNHAPPTGAGMCHNRWQSTGK